MTGNGKFRYKNTRGPTEFTTFKGYAQPTLVAFNPDPSQPYQMVAGGADSGIFLSLDSGSNWLVITNNSGDAANPVIPRPRYARFANSGNRYDIYIGTQGRGVWKLKYRNPTR